MFRNKLRLRGGSVLVALCSTVAAAAILPLTDLAQAQAPVVRSVPLSRSTIAPTHVIQSLDALPQRTMAQGNLTQKPYLVPVDPLTFSAQKQQAKSSRAAVQGQGLNSQAPVFQMGAAAKGNTDSQTVNPLEAAFVGISNASCGAVNGGLVFRPSDMALAVGSTTVGVLQGVNDCLSVFDKNGVQQAGYPKSSPTFFGVDPVINPNVSDPRMIYDWINHRYIYVSISYPNSCANQCLTAAFYNLAVSAGDSPTGGWCFYQFGVRTGPNPNGVVFALPDYPRLGQDRQAVYIASNLFQPNYVGEEVIALRKADLYACTSVANINTGRINNGFTIQPANQYSPNDDPKSMYFVTSFFATSNQLVVSSFHDPFSVFTAASFTQITINAATTYSIPPDATQCTVGTLIATGDQRFSGTAMYASGSIYAALNSGGFGNGQPGIINYQIQPFLDTSGGASDGRITGARVLNEIVRGASSGSNAWYYPAVQPDAEGNVTEVFGFSNSTICPSAAYLSRRAAQAVGTEPDNGVFAAIGPGPYVTAIPERWGDYFATAPAGIVSGGGTGGFPKMWFAAQISTTTVSQWSTVIGRTGYNATDQNIPSQVGSK